MRVTQSLDGMARYEDLLYLTCVGMMLINAAGWSSSVAAPAASNMSTSPTFGRCASGVDPGEDTWAAANRRTL